MFLATSLHSVLLEGTAKSRMLQAFLDRDNSSINEVNRSGETPLLVVLGRGNCSSNIVKILLQYGASVNCKDRHGRSPLVYALECKSGEALIRELLEAPGFSSINEVDEFNDTPLLLALKCDYSANIVRLLLQYGADVSFRDRQGRSLLMTALQWTCDEEVVKVLLDALGATSVNEVDAYHQAPPLVFAIRKNCSIGVIKLLLQYGARVDFRDNNGDTPLNAARHCKSAEEIVKLLIKYTYLKIQNFDIKRLIKGNVEHEASAGFADKCAHEVREMSSRRVGNGRTLRDIVSADSVPGIAIDREDVENALSLLLRMRLDIVCPIYFDMILAKVDKQGMIAELHNVLMCKVKKFQSVSGLEKILLNYECAHEMAQLLRKDELFRLILAFYIPCD